MQRLMALSLLRFLLRSKVSLAMAVLGIGVATASVVSVHLVSVRIEQQLNELVPGPLRNYNYFLYGTDMDVSVADYARLRKAWRSQQHAGMARLTPVIDTRMQLEGEWVRLIGLDLIGLQDSDWLQDDNSARSSSAAVSTWDGVWVDESLAGLRSVPVNGTLDLPPGVVVTDIGRAQALLGWQTDRVSYVAADISTDAGWLVYLADKLLPGFSAGLPGGLEPKISGWRVVAFDRQHPGIEFGRSVLFNVSALAALSLVVAWFLIYQVALNWLRRLTFVFERLQVLGVPAHHCAVYYLGLLGAVGLAAWLLGLALGVSGARTLLAGIGVQMGATTLDSWLVAKAAGCAVGVALLSALSCWWNFFKPDNRRRRGLVGGFGLVLVVLGATGAGFAQTGLIGGFAAIAAVALVVAFAIAPLMSWVRSRLHHLAPDARGRFSTLHLLATREAFWFPKELAVALAGLILAVGTAIGVGIMVSSFRLDFQSFLDQRLAYDVSVEGPQDALAMALQDLRGRQAVQRVQYYQQAQIRYQGGPVELRVSDFDAFEQQRYATTLHQTDVDVLVNEQFARRYDISPGDSLAWQDTSARVAGVVQGFGDTMPRLLVDRSHGLAALAGPLTAVNFNSSQPAVTAAQIARQFPQLEVTNAAVMHSTALATFDRTFVITSILTTIALVVAAVGLYVGVTSLRLNRRGSSALLSSLGTTRWENLGVDLWRSLVMGMAAVIIAVPLGLLLGWLLCGIINPRAFGWSIQMHAQLSAIVYPCVWGLVAAVLAGVVRVGAGEEGQVGVGHAT